MHTRCVTGEGLLVDGILHFQYITQDCNLIEEKTRLVLIEVVALYLNIKGKQ